MAAIEGVPAIKFLANLLGFGDPRVEVPAVATARQIVALGTVDIDGGVIGQLAAAIHHQAEVCIGQDRRIVARGGAVLRGVAPLFFAALRRCSLVNFGSGTAVSRKAGS